MNRVALVTGASRGIGRGMALELAKLGQNLVINYAGNAAAAPETADALCQPRGKTPSSLPLKRLRFFD
jgi:NAD(P)-dependent dehydrogenase (short-subunit alcohol dehydrogenase family)